MRESQSTHTVMHVEYRTIAASMKEMLGVVLVAAPMPHATTECNITRTSCAVARGARPERL